MSWFGVTIGQFGDEVAVEDWLSLNLACEVELAVVFSLLWLLLSEPVGLAPARFVPFLQK